MGTIPCEFSSVVWRIVKITELVIFVIVLTVYSSNTDSTDIKNSNSEPHFLASSDTLAQLDNLVVTATRTERLESELPVSISVVTKEKIEVSPARNVTDIISNQTAVQIKRVTAVGEGIPYEINIRGIPSALAATRTLILVDNIPTNASGTPFLILNQIPLEAIERVEIVRGPFSSIYGANAFGGVINIITKTGSSRPQAQLRAELGNMAYWHGAVWSGGAIDIVSYSLSVGGSGINNYLARDSAMQKQASGKVRYDPAENYDYFDKRVFGKTSFSLSDKTLLTLQVRFFESDLGFGKTAGIHDGKYESQVDIITKGRQILAGPELKYFATDNINVRLGGYFRTIDGKYYNEADTASTGVYAPWVPSYWHAVSYDWQLDGQLVANFTDRYKLTLGADYLDNSINFGALVNLTNGEPIRGDSPQHTRIQNSGIYMQLESDLAHSVVTIIIGLRGDYHSEFGGAFSPKFNISYTPINAVQIHGSTGRAFRAPTLAELYVKIPISGNYSVKPNPKLKPEYVWATDLGINYQLKKILKTEICGFLNLMDNLVVPAINDPADIQKSPVFISHRNSEDVWSTGLETEIELNLSNYIKPSVNYTFQKSKDPQTLQRLASVNKEWPKAYIGLDYIPEHLFNGEIEFKIQKEKLSVTSKLLEGYVGERGFSLWEGDSIKPVFSPEGEVILVPKYVRLPSYWHTSLELQFNWNKKYSLGLSVQNLFNAKYEESAGTLATGRVVFFKAGIKL